MTSARDRRQTVPPVQRRALGYVQGARTRRSLKQWCWDWQEIDAGTLCTQTRCQRENKLSAENNTIVSQATRLGFGALPSFRNIPPPSARTARSGYIYGFRLGKFLQKERSGNCFFLLDLRSWQCLAQSPTSDLEAEYQVDLQVLARALVVSRGVD